VVTDAQTFNVLAGIRALGRVGVPITAMGPAVTSGALWSRYVDRRVVVPSVLADPDHFARCVAARAAGAGPAVVYPGREESLDALLAVRPELPGELVLPYPDDLRALAVRDKGRLAELGRAVGLAAVRTLANGTVADLRGRTGLTPCILKPAVPAAGRGSAIPIGDDDELERILALLPDDALMLLQEVARDPHHSVNVVLGRDGRLVARTQHVTLRTWPVAAGRTALAIGVTPDEDLVERVAELLRAGGFWGLAEVQLMQTERGLAPIDVNTRFYATMELAHASGVNLAAAWHAVVLGRSVPAPGPYRSGVSFRWWEADLSAALRGAPGPLASLVRRPCVGPTWASDDAVGALATAASNVLVRVRRRVGPRLAEPFSA
jgi:predicted ATP-grasp superfamily ATP-dependent carboligase